MLSTSVRDAQDLCESEVAREGSKEHCVDVFLPVAVRGKVSRPNERDGLEDLTHSPRRPRTQLSADVANERARVDLFPAGPTDWMNTG